MPTIGNPSGTLRMQCFHLLMMIIASTGPTASKIYMTSMGNIILERLIQMGHFERFRRFAHFWHAFAFTVPTIQFFLYV